MESSDQIIESEYVAVEPIVCKLSDGTKITIAPVHVEFFTKLRDLPVEKLLDLFNVTSREFVEYLKSERKRVTDKLIELFNARWVFQEDQSQRYYFNDKQINDDFFGEYINKKQLMYYLKKGSFQIDELQQIEQWFEEQRELILKEDL